MLDCGMYKGLGVRSSAGVTEDNIECRYLIVFGKHRVPDFMHLGMPGRMILCKIYIGQTSDTGPSFKIEREIKGGPINF